MQNKELFKEIVEQILKLDEEGVKKKIRDALEKGFSPAEIILEGLSKGMQKIGEKFEVGEYWLPELVKSGNVMKAGLEILKPHMVQKDSKLAGRVVLATPRGDLHNIGKNIVSGLLEGNGFAIYDMGVDVPAMDIVNKAQEVNASTIGLSALISTAVSSMAETIILLKERKIPIRVIIGGAATSQHAADTIEADAYAKDAWEGVKIIQEWAKGGK